MNAAELKSRATNLMNRLNDLGFRKDGNPLVIDHAYELVAAEEGHRNQHILREKLSAYPALFIPPVLDEDFAKAVAVAHTLDKDDWDFANEAWRLIVAEAAKRAGLPPVTAESERAAELAWVNVVNRMGWHDRSEILHLEGFIREKGLMGELAKYVETVGAEEQSFGAEGSDDTPSEAVIAELKALGYRIIISDVTRPYWEFGDDASTDFETEAEAWADAWENAQSRTVELSNTDATTWSGIEEHLRIGLVIKHLGETEVDRLRKIADQAFEDFNFGDELEVAESSGWEWSYGNTVATRAVFMKDRRTPDADTERYQFMVEIIDGQVRSAYLGK
jgi:hypothetical protein